MGRTEPGDSYPIIDEWGRALAASRPGDGGPEPGHGQSEVQF
jgi:hypothetical protein